MEGNDVYKIYLMAAIIADMLAGGNPGVASFSDSLAVDASFEAVRHNRERIFSVHQSLIHVPSQSPRRLNRGIIPYKSE